MGSISNFTLKIHGIICMGTFQSRKTFSITCLTTRSMGCNGCITSGTRRKVEYLEMTWALEKLFRESWL